MVSARTSLDLLFAKNDHVLKYEYSNCWKSITDPISVEKITAYMPL